MTRYEQRNQTQNLARCMGSDRLLRNGYAVCRTEYGDGAYVQGLGNLRRADCLLDVGHHVSLDHQTPLESFPRNVQDEEVLRGADAVLLRNLLRTGGIVAATARLLCHFDCPSRRDCLQRGDARRGDRRRLYGGAEQGRPSEIHRLAGRVL